MKALRAAIIVCGLFAAWALVTWITAAPHYILPGPGRVLQALWAHRALLAGHAAVTAAEIVLGLFLGTVFGSLSAITVASFRTMRRWLLPIMVASQAIPVFAIAPLLVLWLGYGMASKVAMATIIIFFPVAATFIDGLQRTDRGWLDLAAVMTGGAGQRRLATLWHVRLPAALPALASGLRVGAAVAPIGAVIGEWVGSGAGLGYLMLHANARVQTDLMFAAMLTLAVFAIVLYFTVDALLRRLLPWQPDRLPAAATTAE
ncbi:MAG: ABC transporter permease [Alphaproteobacteria bacterium]|nr:ABC transporter permease [Alphaproteobacteria bacterium]